MTSMAFTPLGMMEKGQILTTDKYSVEFLTHLVDAAGAAEVLDREHKLDEYTPEKKPPSLPLLPPDKALHTQTHKKRGKKARS